MLKGRGAQYNPANPFLKQEISQTHFEGIDEDTTSENPDVQLFYETVKNPLSKNDSPDLKLGYSINPYQGCEHGCVYCYARNSHTYWGFSVGLDFESKIIVKKDIAEQLERRFVAQGWKSQAIMLSGNTDCYQPIEKKLKLTRKILEVALKFRNPISIITKNALVRRDLDILKELAHYNLVHVYFSINTLDESLRRYLEPRTASHQKKLDAIAELTAGGVPVGIMNAPVIPGLNHHEIPEILKRASEAGALNAGYTVVRLNGQVASLFKDWLIKTFPDRAHKVLHQIEAMHNGQLNDSEWGRRLTGEGNYADMIAQLFKTAKKKYFTDKEMPPLNTGIFRRGGNYQLF
ncbi:MAG: PA0069 family radical SAM protein [Cyclobacteriaceae bacterium]